MKIAYLGPRGSFSYQAIRTAFPHEQLLPIETIPEIIEQYELGRFDYALIPIENSIEGPVSIAIDKLYHQSTATVVAEIVMPIVQNLMALSENIKPLKIYSHPQALAQTREYLRKNYPESKLIPVASTAMAAEFVQEHPNEAIAAVGNERAADFYSLKLIAKGIQDIEENNTRFWLLGKNEPKINLSKSSDKVSLALTLPENMPGALHKAISTFAWRGIDMTKIESRPLKTKLGKYFFIIDLVSDDKISFALEELESLGIVVRMLGAYSIYEG
ncbi:prephenate dehydratase [Lactococcus fujiensis]|uniref:prephenate dehydratase n=1 Tax=Lactococcus fujiensis TaxID=610251 RepID=UPI000BDECE95|nr:prephenate dehydratase [Lactococcus fujiensis]